MDRLLDVDAERRQVTVQAGARVQEVRCWSEWYRCPDSVLQRAVFGAATHWRA